MPGPFPSHFTKAFKSEVEENCTIYNSIILKLSLISVFVVTFISFSLSLYFKRKKLYNRSEYIFS